MVSVVVEPIKAAWEGIKEVGKAILESKFVNGATSIASGARTAGMVHPAAAEKNFAAAAGLASNYLAAMVPILGERLTQPVR